MAFISSRLSSAVDVPAAPASSRLRILGVAILAVAVLFPLTASDEHAQAASSFSSQLARFKYAMGQVESNGRYTARNPRSGAYGKYQIIPSSWRAWARRYLGNAYAPKTPVNQERVATGKFTSLYKWLRSWPRVAYWWLTGSKKPPARWSRYARRYVSRIMTIYRNTSNAPATPGGSGASQGSGSGSNARAKGVRWTTGHVYFRTGPGREYRARSVVKPGTRLKVIRTTVNRQTKRLWLYVQLPTGRIGWLSAMWTRG